jgi:acetyl esterase/lipase
MVLDPELIPLLGGPSTSDLDDIAGSRLRASAINAETIAARRDPPGVTWRDTTLEGSDGHALGVRIYSSGDQSVRGGALLFVHGGAFVFGDLELEHERCAYYTAHAGVKVISVDYRLAPEFPFPAAHVDVWTALAWLVDAAAELGVDAKRICLGGASAGGALATGVALRCRDESGPSLAALMLMYPVLDDRSTTSSMARYEDYDPWDARRSRQMWPLYLGREGVAPTYAAPARAEDVGRLPPTYLMSCEEDPLRDEDLAFARRLLDAGVSVELHHYRGTYHAFDVIGPETSIGRRALGEQADFLRRTLDGTDPEK